ncbi:MULTISPECIES: acetyl-CoA hydrolase/transferase family protein [Pseudonocardia]|jgi:acyl-CoA hydrolase|uniref:Succinyl-CoA:coenzyme A transferase n=2 Tax=Pseudonocardia TaxID=1847 RepID=A0A1Y2MPI7_PSEAH|nr:MULTISPECIES: acetyl-CoA hydrolase/transferase C-terminal domain-containing protein [Pseudonocardia]OSY37092.1 Succinyl-CoA:coenzyme A transferase [Pseudonocardia autotrophica]TDN72064.1 acyl-CoA hydrolase [Pseudonocardia autotrophica]BBG02762.1 acetyl-CoA hydrolase [Pseudonocardia autotrophica]GEC25905.1 acetyl-CoA hydrolase [Pseudonocardia saturnea]
MIDLRPYVRPGDGVWWSQAGAEATPLVDALLDQVADIGPVRAFSGLTFNRRLREVPPELTLVSYGAMGELRRNRTVQVVPAHYSVLPRLFAERVLPGDVGLVQVSPPGPDGVCSLGIGVDYAGDAVRHSRILIGEINHRMPVTTGTPGIPVERFAATIETDRPVQEAPDRAPDAVDVAVAARVAELVEDGDTVQMGVGALPTAIMDGLAGHRDLGFHSGMLTDGVLRLVEKGVLTGRRKEIDEGVLVTGTAIGSAELYTRLGELPVEFRPASYTHDPGVLARLRRLVAINSAIEVDLSGQVGSEAVGGRYLGGIGGQADFSGAAARTGARSVIALRSTAGEASTIVPTLRGPVSTGRADVDAVVTEHGTAWLRGCPHEDYGARLVAVAAPEHRDALSRALEES